MVQINLLQTILIFLSGIMFILFFHNIIKSLLIQKSFNKYFSFSIATLCGMFYVIFQIIQCASLLDTHVILFHKIKMFFFMASAVSWLFCLYQSSSKKSITPVVFLIVSIFFGVFLLSKYYVYYPVYFFTFSEGLLQFDYRYATFGNMGVIYHAIAGVILIVSFVEIMRIKKLTGKRYIILIFSIAPVIMIHDSLVGLRYFDNILLLDFGSFIMIALISIVFFKEDYKNHQKLENINQELEKTIAEKTDKLVETNKRLQQLATTDWLTGLYNRKELDRKIAIEIELVQRYGKKKNYYFSLLIIDLDNFKYYNDTFGHHVGDMILIEVSRILQSVARNVDFISRFGGDEFVLVLPETEKGQASILAERIRKSISMFDIIKNKIDEITNQNVIVPKKYHLTCSIGLSEYSVNTIDCNVNNDLIINADKALLQAKKEGKNKCVFG